VQARKVVFYGQPIDRLQADLRYTPEQLDITSAQLDYGGSHAQIAGRFDHPEDNWSEGKVSFQVSGHAVNLARLNAVRDRIPDVAGHIEMQMAGEFRIGPGGFRPGALNGRAGVRDVAVKGQPLGSLEFTAATKAAEVDLSLDGELAGSKISGTAGCSLRGNYPARGRLAFTEVQFASLLARLNGAAPGAKPPFNGVAGGTLDFSGNVIDPQSWKGTLQLPVFEVRPMAELAGFGGSESLVFRNSGPILADFDVHGASVRQAQFRARDTNLSLSGRVGFGVRNPWDIRAQGVVNLALLGDFTEVSYCSGSALLDISVRGTLEHPELFGRVDLRNASVNFAGLPNGIDSANGAVLLYRDRVTIETLTAGSGGGKIALTGFISLAGETVFHLQAKAAGVRVRYPEGVSSTSDAALALTGTVDHSLLAGDVTITRVGFNPRSDLGTILARSALPVEVSTQPSRFRQGLRFDVRITTAPEVRFETQFAKDILADASLRLRGDSVRPVLLGRVQISQGEVMFFGTSYTINSGQILFVNASKIEPNVSLDLETRTQGIDVTLHVSGPVNKLNVTYRSDPPLPFSDILALLTTGREPATMLGSLGSLGSQSQAGPSYQQGGANSLVTEAIATPITGRLQRFFGVSRLKIDPQVNGLTLSNAAARVTLEQNITSNVTFTYITDVSRAQAQTIQMKWDLTSNWSAVAIRDENGLFGIDFLYHKQIK
jgi:translocation and assembly module TamB